MATAIDFPERNDWLGKPENQSNHQCYALPIARILTWIPGVIPSAKPQAELAFISCWQLSPEELEEVNKSGGKVFVRIQGATTYPLSIHGQLPVYQCYDGLSDKLFTTDEVEQLKQP